MEKSFTLMEKSEFKHMVEYEINRLDGIIASIQSNVIQIKLAFVGAIFAVILSFGVFIKNSYNLIDIFVSISLFVAIILFIYSNYMYVISLIVPKVIGKPIVKNIPYESVLKSNMDDRKTYLKNLFEPLLKINLSMQILFIISMIAPFIWQSLGLSIWEKAVLWIFYFLIFDILILVFISQFYKEKRSTDIFFDKESVLSDLKNIKSIKTFNLIFALALLIYIVFYPYFWFFLISQYILLNLNYLFLKFEELPFVYLVVLLTTWFFIHLSDEYIQIKYHMQVLVLKQEKYRDIRRQLYETENPDFEFLWSEYKLNAPW